MGSEKKIKIAYFFSIFERIVEARWIINTVRSFDEKKYSVSFVGAKVKKGFESKIPKDISVTNLDNFCKIILLFKLISYIRREKPDIIVSAVPLVNVIVIMAKVFSRAKTKIILTEHNVFSLLAADVINPYKRFAAQFILPCFMKVFYPMADAIVCVSKGVAEELYKLINYKDKIQIIYNPVITSEVYDLAEESLDHPWFKNPEIPVILAAGRLVWQKDYPTLLKAFKLVVQKRLARLVILSEGPELDNLKNLCSEFLISDNVAFLGLVKNQYKYIKRASVFVLSSSHEGFGNVIVEAMALGTPVVSTDCKSGPNEIIEDGKNGILVPVGDYNALSEAILRVLSDPSLEQKLLMEGKKRAECFLFKNRIKQYEELFQKLITE